VNDEELNTKFKQIAQMLGKENVNVPDNLGSILSMLANSTPKEQTPSKQEEPPPPQESKPTKENLLPNNTTNNTNNNNSNNNSNNNNIDDNMEMMRKVKVIMDSMRNINDPRVNLLTAISPFLNNTRQKKIGNCIKLFQMTHMTRLMSEMEKNK
jgi:hypothetical protein